MGGEKLNQLRLSLALVCLTFAIFNPFTHAAAQEPDNGGELSLPAPDLSQGPVQSRPDEAAIVLGEGVDGTGPDPVPVSSGFAVFRMVLALALAAAAIYGVVFFIRRVSRPRDRRNPYLKILASAHLGSNRYVYVINLGSQAWVVGAGEGGVSLISEVTDREALDAMVLESSQKQAAGGQLPDFRTFLRRFGAGGGAGIPPEKQGYPVDQADNVRKNRERLKGL